MQEQAPSPTHAEAAGLGEPLEHDHVWSIIATRQAANATPPSMKRRTHSC